MQESRLKELGDELVVVMKEITTIQSEFEVLNQRAIDLTARMNVLNQREQRIKIDLIEALGVARVYA